MINLWKYKKWIYPIIYEFNYLRYFCKRVKLDFFEVWVGQACSLRCIDCCHLIPYVENKTYNINRLIMDCERVLELCDVSFFSIVGGEPFCNKEIYKLIDYVANNPQITDGKIVTNGTVMPNERIINSLIKLDGKLEVRIDQYPGTEKKVEKFYEMLIENKIRCHISKYRTDKISNWKNVGRPEQEKISPKETEALFHGCFARHCYTLANGELTACPRGILSKEIYGVEKNVYENIQICDLKSNRAGRAKIATSIFDGVHKNYCEYCRSLSDDNQVYVSPGKQLLEQLPYIGDQI